MREKDYSVKLKWLMLYQVDLMSNKESYNHDNIFNYNNNFLFKCYHHVL